MRALIQRVSFAKVEVNGQIVGQIQKGILTLLGIGPEDSEKTADKLFDKISKLRIFEDDQKKMNLSLLDIQGGHLIVSQFTLYADTRQGNRPGFSQAAKPEHAQKIYEYALSLSKKLGLQTQRGEFGASMQVSLCNDGPVTLWLEVEP